MLVAHARPAIMRANTSAANAVWPNEPLAMRTWATPATCGRFGAYASNPRSTRSVPLAGLAATGVPPRRTPRTPDSRMTFVTRPRPIPAGSRPRADDRACVLRYPYTAMKESAWVSRMSRAGVSRLAAMRLTGPDLNMRQPRDSVNSLTAFALNSGVYLVPFAMVPSSPIESGEMRNKNQFISTSQIKFEIVHGDITTERRSNPGERVRGLVLQSLKLNGYRWKDIARIVQISYTDGAFIPDECVRESDDGEIHYGEDGICAGNVDVLRERNARKNVR